MEQIIRKIYIAFMIIFCFCFFQVLFGFHLNYQKYFHQEGMHEVEAKLVSEYDDSNASGAKKMIYQVNLRNTEVEYLHLIFYTIHQDVKVLVRDKCIYRMQARKKNNFGKTPGCQWNDVLLTPADKHQSILIEVTAAYPSSQGNLSKVYLGTKGAVVKKIFMDDSPDFLLSMIAILAGLLFMGYVALNKGNSEVDRSLGYLGAFSVAVGAWKAGDCTLLKFCFPGVAMISLIPFVALLLAQLPMILYIKSLRKSGDSKVWTVLCWFSLGVGILCTTLQALKIKDFRESHPLIIFSIVVEGVALITLTIVDGIKHGWDARLKKSAVSLLVCFGGITLDISVYFISGGTKTTLLGMLIFVGFIITQGNTALREASELATVGYKAQNFEQMAYHDQLTGLYNRTALAIDTDLNTFDMENHVFVILDLNDLKKCNDQLGHECGDTYIRDSAKLIQNVFGGYGKCYRTGGDEFCCIIHDPNHDICKKLIDLLPQKIAAYNEKSKEIHMSIACGYARYDKRIDYAAEDTMKRADERMYKDKAQQKELMR